MTGLAKRRDPSNEITDHDIELLERIVALGLAEMLCIIVTDDGQKIIAERWGDGEKTTEYRPILKILSEDDVKKLSIDGIHPV